MPLTLSQVSKDVPPFIDVPCPGTDDSFRLHLLKITDLLSMQPIMDQMEASGHVAEDGSADVTELVDDMAENFAPIVAKSLGGDWDTPAGTDYLARRLDLLALLFPKVIEMNTSALTSMADQSAQVKND